MQWLQQAIQTNNRTTSDALIKVLYQSNCLEAADFDLLVKQCSSSFEDEPFSFLHFLEKTLLFIAIGKESEYLKKLFFEGRNRCFWPEFQVADCLMKLCAGLLDETQLENNKSLYLNSAGGMLIDWKGHIAHSKLPRPKLNAHLALSSLLFALHAQDRTRLKEVLTLVQWQLKTLDHRYHPFFGLWESEYRPAEVLIYNELLFRLAADIYCVPMFEEISQIQRGLLEKIIEDVQPEVLYFPLAVEKLFASSQLMSIKEYMRPFAKQIFSENQLPFEDAERDNQLSFFTQKDHEHSLALTLSGHRTGCGMYHKNQVALVNFGPQIGRLGDMKGFGIQRTCSLQGVNHSLKQWVGVDNEERFPRHWFELSMHYQKPTLKICFTKTDETLLYMVYYIYAKRARLQGNLSFFPGGLRHFSGPSQRVVFNTEDEHVTIVPQRSGRMQLIPLSEEGHYWGATFILAYEVSQSTTPWEWAIA